MTNVPGFFTAPETLIAPPDEAEKAIAIAALDAPKIPNIDATS